MATTTWSVIDRLNAEWTAMCASPVPARSVYRWAREARALRQCEWLTDVAALLGPSPPTPSQHDDVLFALLRLGRDGDDLALRVVFQSFLGAALEAGMSRTRVAMTSYDEIAQDVADILWEVVATYPLDRRPERIAANIKMETIRRLATRHSERSAAEVPVDPMRSQVLDLSVGHDTEPSAYEDVLEIIAWGVDTGVITHSDASLLVDVYSPAPGEPGGATDVARRLGLSPAAVRQRCSRAIRTLAADLNDHVHHA